jgi:hypothetical protein
MKSIRQEHVKEEKKKRVVRNRWELPFFSTSWPVAVGNGVSRSLQFGLVQLSFASAASAVFKEFAVVVFQPWFARRFILVINLELYISLVDC